MTLRYVAVTALALIAACYNPKFKENIACGADGSCPSGRTCGADGKCHAAGDQTIDAPVDSAAFDAPIDAMPDAKPVACQSNVDCQSPPDLCSKAGTCDMSTHTCTFPAVDCSAMDDACNKGTCDLTSGACRRSASNEGNMCAPTTCGNFSACGGFMDTCDSSGTQSRSCTKNTCQAGTCNASSFTDTQACARTTEGSPCQADQCGAFGACGNFSNTCDSTGTQTRTCTKFTCHLDTCTGNDTTDTQACTRTTEGTSCGASTVTGCMPCSYPTKCADNGSRSCTCTDMVCKSDNCTPVSSTCTQACVRDTTDLQCACDSFHRATCCDANQACGTPCADC